MKKLIYTIVLSVVLWSCGGGSNTPPPAPVNHAPTTPTLVYPTNNLLCIENSVECKWNISIDADQDVITYQIEVAENSAFTQGKQIFNGTSLTQSVPLLEDVAYYWRVKATDGEDSSSYSTVSKFYTYGEGIENHLPFSPELVAPVLNLVVQTDTANLQWTADDVDTTDTLTYDVYFDTVNPPVAIVASNQATNSLTTETLTASTPYYWKIVVKDDKGGQAIGQIWSFITD